MNSDSFARMLLGFVLLSSSFGAWPVAVRLGPVSLNSFIIAMILLFSLIVFLGHQRLPTRNFWITYGFGLIWLMATTWLLAGAQTNPLLEFDLYTLLWLTAAALIFSLSGQFWSASDTGYLLRLTERAGFLYIAVLILTCMVRDEEPATALTGVFFFAFFLSRSLIERRTVAFSAAVVIFLLQGYLGARIVVVANLAILSTIIALAPSFSIDRFYSYRVRIFAISIISTLLLYLSFSDVTTKSINTGDMALEFGGMAINTSGRAYWWDIIFSSAMESPWIGHGNPLPAAMFGVPRWGHPHNDYLRIFHQLGVAGLLIWLFLYFSSAKIAYQIIRTAPTIEIKVIAATTLLGLVGVGVVMLTDNILVYSYGLLPPLLFVGVLNSLSSFSASYMAALPTSARFPYSN